MVDSPSYILVSQCDQLVRNIIINNKLVSHWIALKLMQINMIDSCEWKWKKKRHMDARLEENNTLVIFHPDFSSGTEVVEGDVTFVRGYFYFWEVELLSPVYGTDMMVGLITDEFNPLPYQFIFRSALGEDEHGWGVSYHGYSQHAGIRTKILKNFYPSKFGDGTRIGFHLDTWNGYASLYINGDYAGTLWRSEKFVTENIKPIISSTAARTKIKLHTSRSSEVTLQYLVTRQIAKRYSMNELMELSRRNNFSFN
ncbi:hypothetical protein MXB_2134, partial [Myxobolus squamalis]